MTGCADFDASNSIRCGDVRETNAKSQKFEIPDISQQISITEKVLKFQGSQK